jgi:hypothetical protein
MTDMNSDQGVSPPILQSINCNNSTIDRYIAANNLAIDYQKELLITDLAVVNDPCRTQWTGHDARGEDCAPGSVGRWTFGYMMKQAAGDTPVPTFTKNWLLTWAADQTVNNHVLKARPDISLILNSPWAMRGFVPEEAPFRLLAIVNRIDLAGLQGPYVDAPLGEGRMIFGFLDSAGKPLQATISFEYQFSPVAGKQALEWANMWHHLSSAELRAAPAMYNQALQDITDLFVNQYTNLLGPNRGSSLIRVRTNESAFMADGSWDMREFNFQDASGMKCDRTSQPDCQLRLRTLAATPDLSYNNSPLLAAWVSDNALLIRQQQHIVSSNFMFMGQTAWLAAGNAVVSGNVNSGTWVYPGAGSDPELRHLFSSATCNGCHYGDTNTYNFHIRPRLAQESSQLSPYLTLIDLANPAAQRLTDPFSGGYHGANEPRRRACELARILSGQDTRYSLPNNAIPL